MADLATRGVMLDQMTQRALDLGQELDRSRGENTRLRSENSRLRMMLAEVREEAYERMDTQDTDDGGTRPNIWMSLYIQIGATLGSIDVSAPTEGGQ